jgi:signal peptidase II
MTADVVEAGQGHSRRRALGVAVWCIVLGTLLIDQAIKITVKTGFCLGEHVSIFGDRGYLLFTENNGMAFGMEVFGKEFLSIFRIIAVGVLCFYIPRLIRSGARTGFVVCMAGILAGALGNVIDSLFYGLVFSPSPYYTIFLEQSPATFVPWGEGYSSFLHGKVVDMFYFPLIQTTWPEWIPLVGGGDFVFFSPIFNFADAVISCSIITLLLAFRKDFSSR